MTLASGELVVIPLNDPRLCADYDETCIEIKNEGYCLECWMYDPQKGVFDLIWTIIVFGVCTYLVFWRGHSGAWYLLAMLLGSGMGGESLYKSLREKTRRGAEGQ